MKLIIHYSLLINQYNCISLSWEKEIQNNSYNTFKIQ